MSKLSDNIKNLRLLNGLSQKQLAKMIDRSPNTISNWESGTVTPDADVLEDLCQIFKVNPNQLFGWEKYHDLEIFLEKKKTILVEMAELQKQKSEIDARLKMYADELNRR